MENLETFLKVKKNKAFWKKENLYGKFDFSKHLKKQFYELFENTFSTRNIKTFRKIKFYGKS